MNEQKTHYITQTEDQAELTASVSQKSSAQSKKKSQAGWKRNFSFDIRALGQFVSLSGDVGREITSAINSGQKDVVIASEQFKSSMSRVPYEEHFLWPQTTCRAHCLDKLSSVHLNSATVPKRARGFP